MHSGAFGPTMSAVELSVRPIRASLMNIPMGRQNMYSMGWYEEVTKPHRFVLLTRGGLL